MSEKFVYTKVSQNIITWAPTLADSASLHLCIDCVVFVGSWKKPTDDGQQSAPFSIFLSNICFASEGRAIQVCCV
jgi:hypothetical protein